MKNLTLTICLTLAGLLGGLGCRGGGDYEKGVAAYNRDDFATALREWTPLAEQGDADAQYNLGVMYRKGHGVPQDKVYAHIWYNIAATSGNKKAIKNRDILAEEMTPAQIEKAQDLARECIRKKYKGC